MTRAFARLRARLSSARLPSGSLRLPRRRSERPPERRRGTTQFVMPAFNLLPTEGQRQPLQRAHAATAGTAVGALVVLAAVGWVYALANADLAETRASYDALRNEVASLDVTAAPPAEKGRAKLIEERTQRKSALASALAKRVAWDRILRELSLVIPEDVWLASVSAKLPQTDPSAEASVESGGDAAEASTPSTLLMVSGYTRSQRGVARLLGRLSLVPAFAAVHLISSTEVEIGGQKVMNFSLAASLKPPEAGQ